MRLNFFQVFDLMRRAALQVAAARDQHRLAGGAMRARRMRRLNQAELQVFGTERVARLAVERFEYARCNTRFFRRAGQPEMFATARNGDLAGVFDLTQVFVQCTTQIGQPLIIDWRKFNIQVIVFQYFFQANACVPSVICAVSSPRSE